MSSIVLLVLLCLSMHACNARLLGFVPKESGCRAYHSIEDVGNVLRRSETSMSSTRPTISVEWQTKQVEVKVDAETLLTLQSIPKDDLLLKQGHFHGPTSGHDIFTVSSGIDQKKSIKMKGLERHRRTLLGSATLHNQMEEDKGPKGNKAMEDVGVMDYAQPHRKPPIHNKKS
ncbi:hypothetical protein D8674_028744 [Pyrus ussuriensis x Pyrus communis]|uniref:Uncharacterized protein n=1 Tax=Pyrus ussuriensis x Pyrus communis TaxID=2448454 RepID=A0A5N5I064_9ROSA|nr:hypothetical protein D8674_028744 [Pyrus ussuriensis x Pyrus communis]